MWTCTRCCPLAPLCGPTCPCQCPRGVRHFSNSSEDSDGTPSMSFQMSRPPEVSAALSEREWIAESEEWPEGLAIPAGFLFDTPDLRTLLSTDEMHRVQAFKETVDEQTVPPENVSVTDHHCAEPFAIGGGCICTWGCSPLPYLSSDITSNTSLACDGPWPEPLQLVVLRKTICGPRRVHKAYTLGKTAQPDGIVAKCKVGTLMVALAASTCHTTGRRSWLPFLKIRAGFDASAVASGVKSQSTRLWPADGVWSLRATRRSSW
ncbi:unnamed protein product [Symbiodinium sp. CCMP2456]|nr:unnamed protein product [Symbiodinium sp. CCMP2456]